MYREKVKNIELEARNHYFRAKGGTLTFLGNSMLPSLKEGWRLKIEPVDPERIKIGDIIVFGNKRLICHRVIGRIRRKGNLCFIQKGDHGYYFGEATAEKLIGKVTEVMDKNSKKIDEAIWKGKDTHPHFLYNLLGLFYIFAHFIKGALFGEKQNFITRALNSTFCKSYCSISRLISK